jgi:DNA repair protein RadC
MTNPARPASENIPAGVSIDAAEDIFLLLAARARGLKEAHLWRVDLDRANHVIGCELIVSRGADTHVIHPVSVFRGAIAARASKVVLVHNHSSQELTLTDGDHILTEMMAMFGDLLRIAVYDHVIVTDKEFFSFRDAGHLK